MKSSILITGILLLLSGISYAQEAQLDSRGRRFIIVKGGDTANEIARKFGVIIKDLTDLNGHIIDIGKIVPSDTLFLPQEPYGGGVPGANNRPANGVVAPQGGQYPPNTNPQYGTTPKNDCGEINIVPYRGGYYLVCKFDPRKVDFWLFNKTGDRRGSTHNFRTVQDIATRERREFIFGMNAGMFTPRLDPVGLFVNKHEYTPINTQGKGYGNFYSLPPNGIFFIDKTEKPGVLTTEEYQRHFHGPNDVEIATQSGPMLVFDGRINTAFNEGSTNRKIRNGIGVDRDGNVIMVISKSAVNFYDFTMIFLEEYGCANALCLDGVISRSYQPGVDPPEAAFNFRSPLGTIIAVVKE